MVIYRFSKYAHFLPLAHPFFAINVSKVFVDSVVKLHGIPLSIDPDRDKIFTSLFWKELFKLLGTSLCYSLAYHPQSDGQAERLNQCLEGYLKSMAFATPFKWSK